MLCFIFSISYLAPLQVIQLLIHNFLTIAKFQREPLAKLANGSHIKNKLGITTGDRQLMPVYQD